MSGTAIESLLAIGGTEALETGSGAYITSPEAGRTIKIVSTFSVSGSSDGKISHYDDDQNSKNCYRDDDATESLGGRRSVHLRRRLPKGHFKYRFYGYLSDGELRAPAFRGDACGSYALRREISVVRIHVASRPALESGHYLF